MSLEILLMDKSPHIKKTLHYFLYHYAPVIHCFNEGGELTEEMKTRPPDIVFLDSGELGRQECLSSFQQKPPVVLMYRDSAILKDNAGRCQGQLKKPIDPKELEQIVSHLVPKIQNLKLGPYVQFPAGEDLAEPSSSAKPISSSSEEEEEKIKMFQSSAQSIPVEPLKEGSEGSSSVQFAKDDFELTDTKEITNIFHTTGLLRKLSKEKKSALQSSQELKDQIRSSDQQDSAKEESESSSEKMESLQPPSIEQKEKASALGFKEEGAEKEGATPIHSLKKEESEFSSDEKMESLQPPSVEQKETKSVEFEEEEETPIHSLKKEESGFSSEKTESLQSPAAEQKETKSVEFEEEEETPIHSLKKEESGYSSEKTESLKSPTAEQREAALIFSRVDELFQKHLAEILKTKSLEIMKKTSQEVAWKVIPELSKQLIEREIQKITKS